MQWYLEHLFDFSADDLQANTEGRLTERQIDKLKRYRRAHVYVWGISSAIGILILAVLSPPIAGASDGSVFITIMLLFVLFEYLMIREYRAMGLEIRRNKPNMVIGYPYVHPWLRFYGLTINNETFGLTSKQYEAILREKPLPDGCSVQVYYAPKTKILYSMRLID